MSLIKYQNKLRGFSLIELMIGLALGAFLMLGVSQIFISNTQSNNMQRAFARVQESGRFAMELLAKDIRMADYWGCQADNSSNFTNNLDQSHANYNSQAKDVVDSLTKGGVRGWDNVAASHTVNGVNAKVDTDVLKLSGASGGTSIHLVPPYHSNALHINKDNGLARGDIIMVSDCAGGDIFEISNANPNNSGTVVHNTGVVTVVGNANGKLSKKYQGDAGIILPQQKTYFLSTGVSGTTSLFVATNDDTPQEMVSDVEDMQILYGEDTTGDKVVDFYRTAATVADMDNVIAIRVLLLVASADSSINPNGTVEFNGATIAADGKLRKVYTAVANIRNRMDG
ncbi:PilW family protein [Dasania sp. GY-MA-18]|uniref:PilW family protein n=1 Tax=Dasania phycosphaerae TaxID=2950436 RepID=A0A9J6RNZ4_9GAMM|nr:MULTISPECIES: PilW family protein [Dasania]MCR8923599.1 PilW family protein [Dasania sp. GY-MA-18]MCZ0866033.1 PilW family protein [Dasania phycosphaerae]MCZ0869757.1 PilW family protein [Dasania phycosphaerae]